MNEELRQASEIAKDPASFSWITYSWIIFLAMWGGLVRVLREMKLGEKSWKQHMLTFATELVTSSFVGVVTFYCCEAAEIRPLFTAVLISVAGWMGVRALAVFEALYKARIKGN